MACKSSSERRRVSALATCLLGLEEVEEEEAVQLRDCATGNSRFLTRGLYNL